MTRPRKEELDRHWHIWGAHNSQNYPGIHADYQNYLGWFKFPKKIVFDENLFLKVNRLWTFRDYQPNWSKWDEFCRREAPIQSYSEVDWILPTWFFSGYIDVPKFDFWVQVELTKLRKCLTKPLAGSDPSNSTHREEQVSTDAAC